MNNTTSMSPLRHREFTHSSHHSRTMMFSNIGSLVIDKIIDRQCMTVGFTRKIVYTITAMGSALCYILSTYASQAQIYLVIICMSLAGGLSELLRSCVFVNISDVAPNFSGILCGVSQTIGMGGQFLEPMVMGYVTSGDTSRTGYRTMFLITTAVAGLCTMAFIILGKGKQQDWDSYNEGFNAPVTEKSPLIGDS